MDVLKALKNLQSCKSFSNRKVVRLNRKLLSAIESKNNDKVIKIIEQKHKLLYEPKYLMGAAYVFLKLAASVKDVKMTKINDGLRLVNDFDSSSYTDSEHEMLKSSQEGDLEGALGHYRDYVSLEQKVVGLFEYGKMIAKNGKKFVRNYERVRLDRREFVRRTGVGLAAASVFGAVSFSRAFDALAGGLPQGKVEDDKVPMNKVPGLDYVFDGGVYIWKTPEFPEDRFNKINRTFLSKKDNDLHFLFEVPELYAAIGKHIKKEYEANKIGIVGFGKKGYDEVGISFKIDSKFYVAFMSVNENIRSLLEKYNKA